MKKRLVLITAIALAGAIMLGGCGSRSSELSSITSATNETIKVRQILSVLNYDPGKQVKLPKDYMNMRIKLDESYMVTEDDVKAYIEQILSYTPSYKETNKKTVGDGDVVNLDYSGSVDGEAFDGGTAEDQFLTIGSKSFVDDFEQQLIGHDMGEEFDIEVTFPDDYGTDELNGKDAVFHIKLNYIAEEETISYDDLTDDYVADNLSSTYGASTVDDLKSTVQQQLTTQNQQHEQEDIQEAVLDKLKEGSTVTVPEGLVDQEIEDIKNQMTKQAADYDMEVEDFMSTYYGHTLDEYIEENQENIEESVKERLILQAIIKDQKIEVESADYNSFVSSYASYYGMERDEIIDLFGGQRQMILSYAENEALETVMNAANVTTKMKVPGSDDADTAEAGESTEESSEAE